MPATKPLDNEEELMHQVLAYKYDPLGFVMFAFPWGEQNTPLAKFEGPRQWQLEELVWLTEEIQAQQFAIQQGLQEHSELIRMAISSGRGPGKSALLGMLQVWLESCWWGATTIVTANTEPQLRSRTMAEAGKWFALSINSHWFDKTGIAVRPQGWFAQMLADQLKIDTDYYYVQGQTWSEENPDAFAGAHSQVGMMVIYDEAAGIPKPIWTVTEGFFTDLAEIRIWITMSNPRRVDTPFFECFHKNRDLWHTRYISSLDVEGTDHSVYNAIIKQNGPDSDEARVEVYGQFPRQGSNQFISPVTVDTSMRAEDGDDPGAALLLGVDIARFGEDKTVLRWRQGRNGRVIDPEEFKGLDTMEVAEVVANRIQRFRPDAVFIDEGGVGGGVVDRLKQLGFRVFGVQSGRVKNLREDCENNRTRLWLLMREWMDEGGIIDNHQELRDDLISPTYDVKPPSDKLMLEPVKEMKKRGLGSPDHASALAMTFDKTVARRDTRRGRMGYSRPVKTEYQVM